MNTSQAIWVFAIGVLVGLHLSDWLAKMEYENMVRDIPEFLKEKGDK